MKLGARSLKQSILLPVASAMLVMIIAMGGLLYGEEVSTRRALVIEEHRVAEEEELSTLQRAFDDQQIEWQSMLVRGVETGSYHAHLRMFYEHERQAYISLAAVRLEHGRDPAVQTQIDSFAEAYRQGGQLYREAIRIFNTTTVDPHLAADAKVGTLHKEFDGRIAKIRSTIMASHDAERRRSNTLRLRYRYVSLAVVLVISVMTGLALYRLLNQRLIGPIGQIIETAQTISRGEAERSILVDRNDELGNLQEALEMMRSSLRRSHGELEALNNSLENKVEQRTAEMQRALQLAESANLAKSRFLANMSHELRTPLNGVLGMAVLIGSQDVSDKVRHYAEVIESSGGDLLILLNNLLDLAKLESGTSAPNYEPVDIRNNLTSTLAVLKPQAAEKGLAFNVNVEESVPEILVIDPGFLWHIMMNVVSNAIKFCDAGAIDIDLTMNLSDKEDQGTLQVVVSDTGIGIPDGDLDEVFERFRQVDGTDTRRHGGTGLGLAIVPEMVNLLGGEIKASQREPQGTIITMKLPLSVGTRASLLQSEKVGHARAPGQRVH